jgi:CubicO group peptidase (beta-lactamase class C family)
MVELRRRSIVTGLSALAFSAAGNHRTSASPVRTAPVTDTDDEWQVASPDSQGIGASGLEEVLDAGQSVYPLRSLIVVRNGYLIAERYYGATASSLLSIFSITKSISSLLVGIAMHEGKIENLDQTLGELLPEAAAHLPDAAIDQVTLARILTQRTGLQYDNNNIAPLVAAKDPVSYVQHLPLNRRDPSIFEYSNAGCSLLSPILHRAVGIPEDEYAKQRLFSPLGIKDFSWERDNVGNPMSWKGLRLHTRDLAKIAWMMTDGGRWRGKQVVPADWVRDSTTFHVQVGTSLPPISRAGYGYLWWTGRVQGWPVVWGWGYGSQFAMIVPSLRLAIATNAEPDSFRHIRLQDLEVMALVTRIVGLAR